MRTFRLDDGKTIENTKGERNHIKIKTSKSFNYSSLTSSPLPLTENITILLKTKLVLSTVHKMTHYRECTSSTHDTSRKQSK